MTLLLNIAGLAFLVLTLGIVFCAVISRANEDKRRR